MSAMSHPAPYWNEVARKRGDAFQHTTHRYSATVTVDPGEAKTLADELCKRIPDARVGYDEHGRITALLDTHTTYYDATYTFVTAIFRRRYQEQGCEWTDDQEGVFADAEKVWRELGLPAPTVEWIGPPSVPLPPDQGTGNTPPTDGEQG